MYSTPDKLFHWLLCGESTRHLAAQGSVIQRCAVLFWAPTAVSKVRRWTWLMMTSSNGNIFNVTGPLWEESTGDRWFPSQRPETRSFDVFLSAPEQTVEQAIETPVIWVAIVLIITSLQCIEKITLRTKSRHDVNFVVTGGIGGCHNGNPRCRQRRQSYHRDNSVFRAAVWRHYARSSYELPRGWLVSDRKSCASYLNFFF